MFERLLSPIAYIVILLVLMTLTILSVGMSFVPFKHVVMHIVASQSIAVVKASLVVLFFMHVLRSPGQTRAVIAVTLFWLVVVFFSLTFSDYVTRELLPTVPGH